MTSPAPKARHLGLNPLTIGLLIAQAVLLLLTVAVFRTHGLSVTFDGSAPNRVVIAGIALAMWASCLAVPGPRRSWLTAEALFAWSLLFALTTIVLPAQYGALALGRPFVDPSLAQFDAAMGIDVSALTAWALERPRALALLFWAYGTFQWQMLLAIPVFRLLRDRRALWEFVFHYHVCLIATLVISGCWPVAGPYQWFDSTTPLDLSRVVPQVNGFHDGTLTEVRWAALDGLISMPSFHTIGGLMVIWALRRRWWMMLPMLAINCLMILATVFAGIHFAADILAAVLVFVASLLLYPAVERRLALDAPEETAWVGARAVARWRTALARRQTPWTGQEARTACSDTDLKSQGGESEVPTTKIEIIHTRGEA